MITNYRCTATEECQFFPERNYTRALCGGAEWRDGAWWCTHEGGKYAPDYCSERCGAAVFDDGQIEMGVTM